MTKNPKQDSNDEMRPEYDFSAGVRGKYAQRFREGTNVIVLIPMSPQSSRIPPPSTMPCGRCSRLARNGSEGALPNKRLKLAARVH